LTLTVCPKPIGLGETLQKEYVAIDHFGLCALAGDTSVIEAPIEIVKIAAIIIAIDLLFRFFMFFSLPIILIEQKTKPFERFVFAQYPWLLSL
jgi:hypothetical protein